jgi:hypothetical protein
VRHQSDGGYLKVDIAVLPVESIDGSVIFDITRYGKLIRISEPGYVSALLSLGSGIKLRRLAIPILSPASRA